MLFLFCSVLLNPYIKIVIIIYYIFACVHYRSGLALFSGSPHHACTKIAGAKSLATLFFLPLTQYLCMHDMQSLGTRIYTLYTYMSNPYISEHVVSIVN